MEEYWNFKRIILNRSILMIFNQKENNVRSTKIQELFNTQHYWIKSGNVKSPPDKHYT